MGSIVTGSTALQSHLLSTTTMNRLLLGICCMTKELHPTHKLELKSLQWKVEIIWRFSDELLDASLNWYLTQPLQSTLPVVSLMVRSETKAGYSVSQGTIMVLPWGLWAVQENTHLDPAQSLHKKKGVFSFSCCGSSFQTTLRSLPLTERSTFHQLYRLNSSRKLRKQQKM